MSTSVWTETDTNRALELWRAYQRDHDVSGLAGQAVGIDPAGGRVWFGESAQQIVEKLDTEGIATPLYFLRVGSEYYQRKGGRR
jgi:hypothetical protein